MTHLLIWIAGCLAVAWLLRGRPVWGAALCVVLWTVVPSVAGHHLIGIGGNGIAFHPATWLVAAILLVQLLLDPGPVAASVVRYGPVLLVVTIFALGAYLTSLATGSGGTRLLADQIVGPFLLWWVVVAYGYADRRALLLLRNTVLVTMAVQAGLTLVQRVVHETIFWETDYTRISWFDAETTQRWFGTTDSPLVLSLGLVVAGCLAISVRYAAVRLGLLALYFLGMLVTQSRSGAATLLLIIAFSVLRSRMVLWARALTVVVLGAAAYVVATSPIVNGLLSRVANDTGSTDARYRAYAFVFSHWSEFFASGNGLVSNYAVARDAGLQTSLENSYLMYGVDTGIVLATLFFGMQLVMVVRYGSQRVLPGATLAALLGCLLQLTFSSTAFSNVDGTLIWSALAIVVVARSVDDSLGPVQAGSVVRPVVASRSRATSSVS